jgi:hypothetical protein
MNLKEIDCKDEDLVLLTVVRGPIAGSSEHCNEFRVSMKSGCVLIL